MEEIYFSNTHTLWNFDAERKEATYDDHRID